MPIHLKTKVCPRETSLLYAVAMIEGRTGPRTLKPSGYFIQFLLNDQERRAVANYEWEEFCWRISFFLASFSDSSRSISSCSSF